MKLANTMACWRAYANTLPTGVPHSVKLREDLIEFLHVNEGTVRKYISGGHIQGEPLIRLRVFLSLKGYSVLELKRLPPLQLKLVEMVAFDVITVDDVVKKIGYASASGALRFLRGDTELGEREKKDIERRERVERLVREHEADLLAAKELWNERLGIQDAQVAPVTEDTKPESSVVEPEKKGKTSDDEAIFIGLAKALSLVSERLIRSSTPEIRKKLRDAVGLNEIFILSTSLNRFCSEAANSQYAGRSRDEHSPKH